MSQSAENLLILFAPKFLGFGIDLAARWHTEQNGRTIGLCVGGGTVLGPVKERLGNRLAAAFDIDEMEETWMNSAVAEAEYESFEARYGAEAFGRIVAADRRIGAGFVRGGYTRPSRVKDAARADVDLPARYVIGLCRFLEDVFEKHPPRTVFCYAVAGALAVALAEVCRLRNVRFTRLVHTRIGSNYLVDTDPRGMMQPAAQLFQSALRDPSVVSETREEARRVLADFRATLSQPSYVASPNHDLRVWASVARVLSLGRDVAASFKRKVVRSGPSHPDALRRSAFAFRAAVRRIRAQKQMGYLSSTCEGPFILYTLHVDPEASTMVTSPHQTDQLSVIEALAKWAPIGYTVLVKEHAPMLGFRPPDFYGTIARMPRVKLAPLETPTVKLVAEAALVVTITGTVSWEAMRLGRPSIVVGDVPWGVIERGQLREGSLENFATTIRCALSMTPPSDETIELFIACLLKYSFPMPNSLLWGHYENHDQSVIDRSVEHVMSSIKRLSAADEIHGFS